MNKIKFMTRATAISLGVLSIVTVALGAIVWEQAGDIVPTEEFVNEEFVADTVAGTPTKEEKLARFPYEIKTIKKKSAIEGREALTRGEEVIEEAIQALPERLETVLIKREVIINSVEYNVCRQTKFNEVYMPCLNTFDNCILEQIGTDGEGEKIYEPHICQLECVAVANNEENTIIGSDFCHKEAEDKINAEIARQEELANDRLKALRSQEAIVDYFTEEFDINKLNIN
jgi:hypothetical protein